MTSLFDLTGDTDFKSVFFLCQAAAWHTSAASDHVQGHILAVDGGWLAR